MMLIRLLVLTLTILQLSACSGGGGGGSAAPASPLTKAQKEKLDITAQNVSDVTDWKTDKSQISTTSSSSPEADTTTAFLAIETLKANSAQTKADLQAKILDPQACAIKLTEPKRPGEQPDPSKPMNFNFENGMSIGGSTCPIDFSWSTKMDVKMNQAALTSSMNGALAMRYAAQSVQAKLLDVELYQVDIKMASSSSQEGATGSINGTGKIVSKSQGTITLGINGDNKESAQGILSNMDVRLSYPDGMIVEFKNVTTRAAGENAEVQNTFYLNNEKITEEEFDAYTKMFGMDKLEDKRDPSEANRRQ